MVRRDILSELQQDATAERRGQRLYGWRRNDVGAGEDFHLVAVRRRREKVLRVEDVLIRLLDLGRRAQLARVRDDAGDGCGCRRLRRAQPDVVVLRAAAAFEVSI